MLTVRLESTPQPYGHRDKQSCTVISKINTFRSYLSSTPGLVYSESGVYQRKKIYKIYLDTDPSTEERIKPC